MTDEQAIPTHEDPQPPTRIEDPAVIRTTKMIPLQDADRYLDVLGRAVTLAMLNPLGTPLSRAVGVATKLNEAGYRVIEERIEHYALVDLAENREITEAEFKERQEKATETGAEFALSLGRRVEPLAGVVAVGTDVS